MGTGPDTHSMPHYQVLSNGNFETRSLKSSGFSFSRCSSLSPSICLPKKACIYSCPTGRSQPSFAPLLLAPRQDRARAFCSAALLSAPARATAKPRLLQEGFLNACAFQVRPVFGPLNRFHWAAQSAVEVARTGLRKTQPQDGCVCSLRFRLS